MRLGHINLNRINRLIKDSILDNLVLEPMPVYESCVKGKMTMRPFPPKGSRSNDLLELVHTDMCGPINIRAHSGYEYFITFIDDHSRYEYVYLMHHKSNSFEKLREYMIEVEKQLGKPIKAIRSNRDGKYLTNEFIDHLVQNGILSQWSAPRMPQQNGIAEKRN